MKKTIFGWTIKSSSRSFDVHQFFPITNLHGIEQLKWSLNRLDDLEHINLHCHRTRMRIIIKSINRRQFFSSFFRFFSAFEIYDHANAFATVIVLTWRRTKYLEDPKKKKHWSSRWRLNNECVVSMHSDISVVFVYFIYRCSFEYWLTRAAHCIR